MTTLYRIQDRDGRGPYKPGFSHLWSDPRTGGTDPRAFPNIFQDFGADMAWKREINSDHCGCAFPSLDALRAWFSDAELERLIFMGYRVVALDDCRIVRESKHQILFARHRPLKSGAKIVTLHYPVSEPAAK